MWERRCSQTMCAASAVETWLLVPFVGSAMTIASLVGLHLLGLRLGLQYDIAAMMSRKPLKTAAWEAEHPADAKVAPDTVRVEV